jgi:hypothetical protein
MKYLIYCLAISNLMLQSCGKKCLNDTPVIEINSKINDYFGMYKNGNWWIYENASKTKRDSIFVTDYDESFSCPNTDYINRRFRRLKINSKFLTAQIESKFEVYLNENSIQFLIDINLTAEGEFKKSSTSNAVKNPELFETFNLSNVQLLKNVLKIHNAPNDFATIPFIMVAPKIGVVQFVNSGDTFNLKTFKIN